MTKKMLCQLIGPQAYLQWVQRPQLVYRGFIFHFQRKLYFLHRKGVQHFPGEGGVELNCSTL